MPNARQLARLSRLPVAEWLGDGALAEFAREEMRRFVAPRRPSVLTIGNFDGVHRGHQHLVAYVMQRARERGYASGAITLYPDPARVLRPSEPTQYLTSLEE